MRKKAWLQGCSGMALRRFLVQKPVLWAVFTINLAGAIFGYVWYAGQVARTMWYFVPFVPDSPLSVTWLVFALLAILLRPSAASNRPESVWNALGVTWLLKYGLWCDFTLLYHWVQVGPLTGEAWLLVVSHFLMAFESLLFTLFVPLLRFRARDLLLAAATLFANDYVDYVYGVFPYLPQMAMLPIMTVVTPLLSLAVVVFGNIIMGGQKVNPSPSTS